MDRKEKYYQYELKTILGMYGVSGKRKDEFLNRFLRTIEDQVADQFAGYFKQLSIDALAIMLREHGYGKKRWQAIEEEYRQVYNNLDLMSEVETRDNFKYGNFERDGQNDIPYLKAQVDKVVEPLYEGYFLPYDDRYRKAQKEAIPHNWEELRRLVLHE